MAIQQARFYSSDALPTTLASSLGTTGNPSVASLPGTWPSQYPYTVLIDWGLSNQEAISVTGPPTGSGPFTLPCTRAVDGSTGGAGGLAHASGAIVVHGVTAQDFDQPLKFIDGVSGLPWQFNVMAPVYGAKGDGKIVTDGAMSSSSSTTTLTCATSAPFTSADVGKSIHVGAAGGGSYTPLCTTIATYVSASQVTLTAACTSTVASAIVAWATDDTAAVNAAVSAANTYAQANAGYAEIIFPPAFYGIGTAPTIGGGTLGNAQIPLPVITGTAGKVTLVFRGTGGTVDVSGFAYWQQTTPQANGPVLMCLRNDGTVNGTYGPSHIIGGPFSGYGGNTATFSNMQVVVDGIMALVPYNGTYGGFDFYGVAEAEVPAASVNVFAVPPVGGSLPSMATPANITNLGYYGLRMPSKNNNENSTIGVFNCEGLSEGLGASEHTTWVKCGLNYCFNGLVVYNGSGAGGSYYGVTGVKTVIGECHAAIVFLDGSGASPTNVHLLDVGLEGNGSFISDASNFGGGEIHYAVVNGSSGITGAANIKLVNLKQLPGLMASPPAVPASGVVASGLPFRPAMVNVQPNGATITAITVGGTVMTGITSGFVPVPSQAQTSIALTYSGGTPVWQWWLTE